MGNRYTQVVEYLTIVGAAMGRRGRRQRRMGHEVRREHGGREGPREGLLGHVVANGHDQGTGDRGQYTVSQTCEMTGG